MLNFSHIIDLPLVWGGILAFSVFVYVLLDGFDLGIGILFPFAPSDQCRDRLMNSIAPYWDGNETWLVLGGACLFAAFPLAYSILMPAFYIPLIIMLLALIFRGVAFEFRFKSSQKSRPMWDYSFHFGSLVATFCQGMVLGNFVKGVHIEDNAFAGGPLDWLHAFPIFCGLALVFGYMLLGATWLVMKTDSVTQIWARKCASYSLIYVLAFMGIVSLWVPYFSDVIYHRWFSMPNFLYLSVVPIMVMLTASLLVFSLYKKFEYMPFILSIVMFILGYLGLIISVWPYVVPHGITLREAAAAPESLSLMLIEVIVIMPVIIFYTGYCYYVFRGKSSHEEMY